MALGCETLFPPPWARSRDFSRVPKITEYKLWEHLQEAVNEEFDIRLADDEKMEIETEWNEHLGPMFKMGRRFMAEARVVQEERQLYFEVIVRRERNANLARPLDRRETDWESDGHDMAREKKILWLVTMRLVKFNPSTRSLNPEKSRYLTSEKKKQEKALWSDQPSENGGSSPSPPPRSGKKEIWKD